MSDEYMTVDHADAFAGMPVHERPDIRFAALSGYTVICPLCKGHGGWHLRIDESGAGKHFDAHCAQCNGWGWVKPGLDATCIHVNGPARNIGRCYNEYTCLKCGRKVNIDSSD